MVIDRKVVLRYVRALFALAQERDVLDAVAADLSKITAAFEETPDLKAFLTDPRVQLQRKRDVVRQWLEASLSEVTLDFLDMLVSRGREQVMFEADDEFRALLEEARGIERARVVSARPLDETLRSSLKARLESMTGKTVELSEEVEETLVGGLRIHVGNRLYDGSVQRKIVELERQLVESSLT